jgi:hypothetical protein
MSADTPPLALAIEPDALLPLIQSIVSETLAALEQDRQRVPPERLAYSEAEAAALMGLHVHQLRDEREKMKRIGYTRIVGGRIRYTPDNLHAYLQKERVEPAA